MRTLLELGSGGGNNASHLKRHAAMTLVEPAAGMRAVSAALNPVSDPNSDDTRYTVDYAFEGLFSRAVRSLGAGARRA